MKNNSNYLSVLDGSYHVHSFTNLSKHGELDADVISHGEGVYLTDSDGNQYLDAMSGLWCATLGYSEKRLIDAAVKQMSTLPYCHSFRGRSNEKLIRLAEKLVSITPDHLKKVYFAGSGSEANESAVKMAWSYHKQRGKPEKRKIISRLNGYHGSTIFASQLSGMTAMHEHLNTEFPDVLYADCPDYSTEAQPGESETEFTSRLAERLERQILSNQPDTIAAFIAEPVMAVGGVVIPPKGYFEEIQSVLAKYDILMIADEVVCGFGRTGNMFGSETFNIKPDIMTVAKGISSAYFPMSAAIVTNSVYDALVQMSAQSGLFSHGFTYSGHPVGAAIALEAIAVLEEREILKHVRIVSQVFQSKLKQLLARPHVANVRSIGLMGAFDLLADNEKGIKFNPNLKAGSLLMDLAAKNGLFVRAVGDTIVLAPPLIVTELEIYKMSNRLRRSIEDLHNSIDTEL